jgi:hypothetical protein
MTEETKVEVLQTTKVVAKSIADRLITAPPDPEMILSRTQLAAMAGWQFPDRGTVNGNEWSEAQLRWLSVLEACNSQLRATITRELVNIKHPQGYSLIAPGAVAPQEEATCMDKIIRSSKTALVRLRELNNANLTHGERVALVDAQARIGSAAQHAAVYARQLAEAGGPAPEDTSE